MSIRFIDLLNSYIEAFNAQKLDDTLSYLSPDLKVTYYGKELKLCPEELRKAYTEHWSEPGHKGIIIKDAEELEGGVRTTLYDEGRGNLVKVVYWFSKDEAGNWKQTKHDILEVKKVG